MTISEEDRDRMSDALVYLAAVGELPDSDDYDGSDDSYAILQKWEGTRLVDKLCDAVYEAVDVTLQYIVGAEAMEVADGD